MSDEAYFQQIEKNLHLLVAEKKYEEAYNTLNGLMNKYPDEPLLKSMKKEIETRVEDQNKEIINEKIKKIEPLWKQKDYAKILGELTPMRQICPDHGKLNKLIDKAQIKYQKEVQKLQKDYLKNQKKRLEEIHKQTPGMLLDELFNLEKQNVGNEMILELTHTYREKIIIQKIKEKEELLFSDKYGAIENFITQLKKINDKSPQISKLEKMTKGRQYGTQMEEKKEFVYKAKAHLDTLMKLKKYDKAIKTAKEILELNPDNLQIAKVLKKAKEELFYQNRDTAADNIEKSLPALKAEYKKDKSKFVKL